MAPNFGRRGAPAYVNRLARERRAAVRAQATVYQKHRTLPRCREATYRSDACPVPEGHAEVLARAKHRSQAPVNGGRNYNGPKVAKFLVG